VSGERHRHLLLQSCAAVAAGGAVNLDQAGLVVVGKLDADNRDRRSGDLQHIPYLCSDRLQIIGRQSSDSMADILDTRFRDAQR